MKTNIFSAEEPTLGYLYQINYSLLLLLKSSEKDDAKVGIEKLDDIQLEDDDSIELFQTKFHLNSVANLSNRSSDFWKTIRVWSDGIANGSIDVDTTAFHLITTATASSDSFISQLRKDVKERNIDQLLTDLDEISKETSNQTNRKGYQAYRALKREDKIKLLHSIFVLDASVNIAQLKHLIYSELRKTVIDTKVPRLYQMILGWYFEQAINNLTGKIDYISFKDLQHKCFEFIDTLKIDNLPADFPEPVEFAETDIKTFKERTFVKQLNAVGVGDRSVRTAISDYYRAYEQRSKWIRECLIEPSDEISYDQRLFDDWKRKFDAIFEEASTEETEEEMKANGKRFYLNFYVNNCPRIFIKERFEHVYMVAGSCQILSDRKKIGWHPNYETKV